MSQFMRDNLNFIISIGCVFGALCIATLSCMILRKRPDHDYSELRLRIRTWWIIVAVFAAALLSGKGIFVLFMGFVELLGKPANAVVAAGKTMIITEILIYTLASEAIGKLVSDDLAERLTLTG